MTAISSPQPTVKDHELAPAQFIVLLGADDGTAPTLDNEVDYLKLLSYTRTAGGSRLDAGRLEYRLDLSNQRLMDIASPVKFHRQIEIRRRDEDGEPTIVETWGFLQGMQTQINATAESLMIDFRLDPFVFGDPLTAMKVWSVDHSGAEEDEGDNEDIFRDVHWRWVFNPEIDRTIEGNRSSHRKDTSGPYAFISPESLRTGAARVTGQRNDTGTKWKPSEAVHRLCWSCNPDETYVKNPTLEELQDAFSGHDDEDQIKNHVCVYGQFLPALLDELLRKIGFGWYLEHSLNDDDERETTIQFYRRGEGVAAQLLMQRPGETFSFKDTNVDDFSHSVNLATMANVIIGQGSFKRYESTFPLIPGWSDTYDTKGIEELARDHTFGKDNPTIGRQYVLNEAGDFCEPAREGITDPFDFAGELIGTGDWEVVRRKFFRCLSQHQDGDDKQSYGYVLEWWDRNLEGATDPETSDDPGWTKVKTPFQVLEHQCGVHFDEPPGYLWELVREDTLETPPEGVDHPGLNLRLTASVDADRRLECTADKRDSSPQGETLKMYLDVASKFHFREVLPTSVLYEKPDPDTVDDESKLQTYVDQVRDLEDAGDVTCSITLPGVEHAEFMIGMLLDRIDGRNITLTANNPDASTPRSLQIVGLNYQVGRRQMTELLIETFRKERPVL